MVRMRIIDLRTPSAGRYQPVNPVKRLSIAANQLAMSPTTGG